MNKTKWTEKEVSQLKSLRSAGASLNQIAKTLGRTRDSVNCKVQCLGLGVKPAASVIPETTLAEDISDKDEKFWKRQHNDLSKKYQGLLTEKSAVDRLVTEVKDMAPKSYATAPATKHTPKRGDGTPQSAVLELSDTHIGAVVQSSQTLTFGKYDFPTFLARLKYLEDSVISIVENHITTPVPELVITMLGDMLDGALSHSNECGQPNPMFNQFFGGAHALAQFVRNLAPHFPKLRIYDVVGNHPRYQNQRKMPTVNKHSNFDKFLYALIRELLRDVPNVEWDLHPQPFQVFDVQGFSFFAGHGETLRGGDKALGVPNHAIGRLVSTTSQLFGKNSLHAPNYYLFGHLHRPITLPHATGEIIVNGGFVGLDGFGLAEMFTPSDPLQKLFFVHPRYGKTATYDIGLKFAQVGKETPYTIPEGFHVQ
jgi:hypothetical protein